MPRPIWSGAISFGLVNVPVKLLSAVRKKTVRFHQLHAADGARIQQRRICSADGAEVPYEELAKGYEIYPGQYVVVDQDELDELDPVATHTIDIEDFVSLDDIDPVYYDTTYYLLPDERGAKAYALLLDAMRDSQRVGIARVVLRTKQYLCAVRPIGAVLALTTMNFADEVVPVDELGEVPSQPATERELTMARQLIESLTTDWDPQRYHDTYREEVMALIEAKAEGQALVSTPTAAPSAPVIDLMAALEASLRQSGAAAGGDGPAEASGEAPGAEGPEAPKPTRPAKSAKSAKRAGSRRRAS